jgi:RNA polymerase sigma-70 factor (ECF subfamily)
MTDESGEHTDLLARAAAGDQEVLRQLFSWLRHMTGLKLAEVHRRHLVTQLRDADREVSLHRGGLPEADSASLAAQLLGKLTTPSQAAINAEQRIYVQEALKTRSTAKCWP